MACQSRVQENTEPLTITPPQVQTNTSPRVQFNLNANKEQPNGRHMPPQLIVESSPLPPILKHPTIYLSESIADIAKCRQQTPPSFGQLSVDHIIQW